MTSTHAQAAKAIRADLKAGGIKGARVRSSYDKITVDLPNDLMPATVEAIKLALAKYQAGHFNGMEDIYEYSNTNSELPQVRFIFVQANYSDELMQKAWDFCRNYWADMEEAPELLADAGQFHCQQTNNYAPQLARRTLSEKRGGFWAQHKPRLAA